MLPGMHFVLQQRPRLTLSSARRKYYAQNYIGWCSRPPNGQDGFVRGGRFKKASNMNYCLDFSNRVEDELLRLIGTREEGTENITLEQENELYQQALDTIIASDEGRTLAAGNVRLGEIILLIDCDTRVVSAGHRSLHVKLTTFFSLKHVCIWEL